MNKEPVIHPAAIRSPSPRLAGTRAPRSSRSSGQTEHRFQEEATTRLATQYLLFLPAGYDRASQRRWPLILFLHGSGERGSNLKRVAAHGPPKLVKSQPEFPFIVVSPQCPSGEYWSPEILLALLRHVVAEQAVDVGQVYLTGLSMGGYGAWDLALSRPELFAAVAPICGGGDILPILLADQRRLRALQSLPVWAFHGDDDPVVPVQESERMIQALRQIGNGAKLTIYPGCGHDSWTETYQNPALFEWFLSQRRRK